MNKIEIRLNGNANRGCAANIKPFRIINCVFKKINVDFFK